jgi:hypothetical protein
MKQPKYSPQEALERIKLMMNYDSSKTLNENKEVLSEQFAGFTNKPSNTGNSDVDTIVDELNSVGNTDEQKIVNILKKYNTQSKFTKFLSDYKSKSGKDLGVDMLRAFTSSKGSDGIWAGGRDPLELNDLESHLKTINMELTPQKNTLNQITGYVFNRLGGGNSGGGNSGGGNSGGGKSTTRRSYIACSGTAEQPFKKLCYEKDPNGPLHKVQACLGVTADGKFWNKTEQALVNKTGKNTFTISDVETICGASKPSETNTPLKPKEGEVPTPLKPKEETPTPEISGEIIKIDATKTDF